MSAGNSCSTIKSDICRCERDSVPVIGKTRTYWWETKRGTPLLTRHGRTAAILPTLRNANIGQRSIATVRVAIVATGPTSALTAAATLHLENSNVSGGTSGIIVETENNLWICTNSSNSITHIAQLNEDLQILLCVLQLFFLSSLCKNDYCIHITYPQSSLFSVIIVLHCIFK